MVLAGANLKCRRARKTVVNGKERQRQIKKTFGVGKFLKLSFRSCNIFIPSMSLSKVLQS